jgi:peptidoglycan/LPS O-acetylase OafA/YrhL
MAKRRRDQCALGPAFSAPVAAGADWRSINPTRPGARPAQLADQILEVEVEVEVEVEDEDEARVIASVDQAVPIEWGFDQAAECVDLARRWPAGSSSERRPLYASTMHSGEAATPRSTVAIADAFHPKRNSLNAIRLVLAILVIVSHTWPIGGYGDDPMLGDETLGTWAVAGFFAISGYLITASRLHTTSFLDYLSRRIARIYPAFAVVLIVTAFVIAPLSAAVTGDGPWTLTGALGYVEHNAFLQLRQYGIGGTLSDVPYARVWNGSLWTLFYEFLCYLVVGIGLTFIPRRWAAAVTGFILVACSAATLAFTVTDLSAPTTIELLAKLGTYFAAGALLYQLSDRIPKTALLAISSAGVILVSAALGVSAAFAGLPIAYLMIYAGIMLPLNRVGARHDISYGMYVYAFPVQQLLVQGFPDNRLPVAVFAALAILCTLPLAWVSSLFVEQPALRLRTVLHRHLRARHGTTSR